MSTDFTPGSTPERLPLGVTRIQPKHLGSNLAVGKCPGCKKATSWAHCGAKGCKWLFCMSCRIVWSERTGRSFKRDGGELTA